jgi:hypothetical protein
MYGGRLVAILDGPTAGREDVGLLMATGGREGGITSREAPVGAA